MGGGETSNGFRERLERDIDGLQAMLKQANERNKPQPVHYDSEEESSSNGLALFGAAAGAAMGGSAGAFIGGVAGKILGDLFG